MAELPPNLNFAATEEEICARWAKEGTFKTQDLLSQERGDEVKLARRAPSFMLLEH
jgi:isoleucyl-tRNA synthetase